MNPLPALDILSITNAKAIYLPYGYDVATSEVVGKSSLPRSASGVRDEKKVWAQDQST